MNTHTHTHTHTVQESTEEHPGSMCPPAGTGAPPPRCPAQHPQARGGTVLQSAPPRPQGTEGVCHFRRAQEGES